ncbi:MAG: SCP2 sterol-binding domain-containing protein [Anaerolineae bacterium]
MSLSTREQLAEAFPVFLAALQANQEATTRYTNWEVSARFKLTDLNTSFSLRFAKGSISGAIDDQAATTIGVICKAQVLDDLFSGRLDGESAYMLGRITLEGSEYTAESLLGYMPAIRTAWKQALP